jgi:hypothetical protein
MRKLILTLFGFTILISYSLAQVSTLDFRETLHDFGTIKEADGSVKYRFNFVNQGKTPAIIQSVKPSCGCTTPAWSKDPVAPGEAGFIEALFNPANRPGPFLKTLLVTTNVHPNTVTLKIKGSVLPVANTPAEEFPLVLGNLRAKRKTLYFGRITNYGPLTREFEIYNQSQDSLVIDSVLATSVMEVSVQPKVLQPEEKGKIIITYDPRKKKDLGYMTDNITLVTNDSLMVNKSFDVVANIEEYFPVLSEDEIEIAPKIVFESTNFDFGTAKDGNKLTTSFKFNNTGKSNLNIRKANSNCDCTIVKSSKKDLKPGESGEIQVTFDTSGRTGNQSKFITVYTNDPVEPIKKLVIKAKVL